MDSLKIEMKMMCSIKLSIYYLLLLKKSIEVVGEGETTSAVADGTKCCGEISVKGWPSTPTHLHFRR